MTERVISWYAFGALAAIGLGGVAALLNLAGIAPVGILPIAIGVVLGAVLIGLAAAIRIDRGKRLIIGTLLMAIVVVLAEHAWLYVEFRREWHRGRAESPQIALFRPETPWTAAEYFRRQATPHSVALWSIDAAVIAASAVGSLAAGRRFLR